MLDKKKKLLGFAGIDVFGQKVEVENKHVHGPRIVERDISSQFLMDVH